MNIKHYLSAAAAITLFAACSDYDPGMSENSVDLTDAEIKTLTEYTNNFVERYGEMDSNHTWGFGELAEMEARGTRAVQVDRNDWTIYVYEDGQVKLKSTVGTYRKDDWDDNYNYHYMEKAGYVIPGFPSPIDDLYHCDQGSYTQTEINTMASNMSKEVNEYNLSKAAELSPIGDVTDEEVQYVSWWFRTHPKPKSVTPPFTEFFIQDISQDFDRDSYPSGNQIYTDYADMDYFSVQTSDGYWEHINNFNQEKANEIENSVPAAVLNGDTTALATLTQDYPERTLKYWTSEGPYERGTNDVIVRDGTAYTTSFSYHNSDDNKDYENYVLVHLKFIGPISGKPYDGYYLAFDYEMHKDPGTVNEGEITDIARDWYYSNWIVKLAPGNPEFYKKRTVTLERRVMCEDLGSTYDFDFNDLVFDVKYTREEEKDNNDNWQPIGDGKWTATITLQASGGTLPIYIKNFDGTKYDVHETMGGTKVGDRYSPINVGTGLTKDPVALPSCQVTSTNPDDIVILVYSSDQERSATKELELPSSKGLQNFGENLAPQKICMPTDVRWLKEYQQIEWGYPYFSEWVQKQNGAAGFGNESDWTRTDVDETKLYK